MGSSSKKYKEKEKSDRKRRHHSHSVSEEESPKEKRHRHTRRHHHKDRRRDQQPQQRKHEYESNDSDVVEISDQEQSPALQQTSQRQHLHRERERERESSPEQIGSGQAQESLSIEETNKLRAKLGLKPLQVDNRDSKKDDKKDDGKKKDDWGEFYHKPASNISHTNKTEKIKNKLTTHKEKRKIEAKLQKVKLLGESYTDDDIDSWVNKSRNIEDAKKKAQQRAKALEELDEQFGVGDFIDQERRTKSQKRYTEKNLHGLNVEHGVEAFKEGKIVVLTLKDQGVLDEDDDVLVNVNMLDDERYKKNVDNKKKKVQYNPYDAEELDEFGNPQPKNLLNKYDEEIDGVKKDSFQIGSYEASNAHRQNTLENIKQKLANKRIEYLPDSVNLTHLASDYYNEEEMEQFKKPRKKMRKIRQKEKILTADDLEEVVAGTSHARNTDKSDKDKKHKLQTRKRIEIDEEIKLEEKDDTLERALQKARSLKQKQRDNLLTELKFRETIANIKPEIKEEPADVGNIILNTTAEFCRTLGDIPTYGKSGNREEIEELMDYDKDLKSDSDDDCQIVEDASTAPANWNAEPPSHSATNEPILDEEPDVGIGVGAALKLAMSKGYLDKEESNRPSNSRLAYLQAKHYSIEDKNYGEEFDRSSRHTRYAGPVQEFKEKDMFKPNVKLEYIDDEGHVLNSKEAFRYLSHKFHGKGPGKNKIEKRLKKSQQEGLMKKMSSTDTPLGTLNMLQAKQKEMQSPYIVLSGGKTHSTSISKARR